jgi:hypothetical protein
MPLLFRLPVLSVLLLLQASPLLLARRPLPYLALAARLAHLKRVQDWRLLRFPEVLKLVRSLSLLAWCSLPEVQHGIGYDWPPAEMLP